MKNKIKLLPFWFKNFNDEILLVNQCGDFLFISREDFKILLRDEIPKDEDLYLKLKGRLFLADEEDLNLQTDFIANQLRTRKSFLRDFTSLHMVVVTCRCNFRCEYCHASSSAPTAKILEYCKRHKIFISTSMDGLKFARTGDKKFLLGNVLTDEW